MLKVQHAVPSEIKAEVSQKPRAPLVGWDTVLQVRLPCLPCTPRQERPSWNSSVLVPQRRHQESDSLPPHLLSRSGTSPGIKPDAFAGDGLIPVSQPRSSTVHTWLQVWDVTGEKLGALLAPASTKDISAPRDRPPVSQHRFSPHDSTLLLRAQVWDVTGEKLGALLAPAST